jgi:ATP-binding protein involved in chromosome partitioning
VAPRAAFWPQPVHLAVTGVVDNMPWFPGDDGTRNALLGAGGGDELAHRLADPRLGRVPLVPEHRAGRDSGAPIVATDPDGEAASVFATIAERVDVELAPKRIYRSELKIG